MNSTVFRCDVPAQGVLTLQIFDVTGRIVKTLYSGEVPAGEVSIPFNLTDRSGQRLPAGVYPVMAVSGGQSALSRLVVLGN